MKRFILTLLIFTVLLVPSSAQADWRWSNAGLKRQKVTFHCNTMQCIHLAYKKAKHKYHLRVRRYNQRRLKEWKHWSRLYIPTCTWLGESGVGPQFARFRYSVPNSGGSGAYGKYQMMSGTYHSQAKYHDWSPLDQEIAGHKEFYAHGTGPWDAC